MTRFEEDVEIISQLSDRPNDEDGLSAQELKAKFDAAAVLIKEFINEILIPETEAAIDAAAAGISHRGISGSMIEDNTVTETKLSSTRNFEAVVTNVIRDLAITRQKIANYAVGAGQIENRCITKDKIALNTISELELGTEIRRKLENIGKEITMEMLSPALQQFMNSHQMQHKTAVATLPYNGTAQWNNIPVTGVTQTNTIVTTPSIDSYIVASNIRARCIGQDEGTLSFSAESAPGIVGYDATGDGEQKAFQLPATTDITITSVKVDNVETHDYTYDASTKTVTFTTAPADGKAIRVDAYETGSITFNVLILD